MQTDACAQDETPKAVEAPSLPADDLEKEAGALALTIGRSEPCDAIVRRTARK